MTDTEETVLMKCAACGYEEEVPEWVLQEMAEAEGPNTEYEMICPECEHRMFPKNSSHFSDSSKKIHAKKSH
jgi:DNA-directed RNA polymerase subunit RPC12/RpoP